MLQAGLGINRRVPKELSGVRTSLHVARSSFFQACFSHRASCSTSVAVEGPVGATEGDTLGIAPQGHSTAVQDPFQCLASPESSWAGLAENSAGCRVPVSACNFCVMLLPSAPKEQHSTVIPPPRSLFFGIIWHLTMCSHHFVHMLLLAKTSWKQSVGWAGRARARDLLGWISLLCYCWERHVGSLLRTWRCQSLWTRRDLDTRVVEGWQEKILVFNCAGPSPHP